MSAMEIFLNSQAASLLSAVWKWRRAHITTQGTVNIKT